MTELHKKGSFVRFKTELRRRTTCVFFATSEPAELRTHYISVIIQDSTFNTTREFRDMVVNSVESCAVTPRECR